MYLDESGMDLSKWRELVETKGVPADMAKFSLHMQSHSLSNSVITDCTASARVAETYYEWVKKGIHIITPNKKANSGPFDQRTGVLTQSCTVGMQNRMGESSIAQILLQQSLLMKRSHSRFGVCVRRSPEVCVVR